ncbi:uncharacterized protein BO96DRAFT_428278 [Aspergillus niger CBS 101883]|uniref:uncharacterized protein n=1 Tax=Aspergillus lacticoffeatus (strain CBS 101883) TaxID=1450533 RepID=UPI000D7F2131|nr:uncharacterized protein BO96DRAFT_428278 [Aspergillus niger CBS 101883]PYH50342.1 hypothetical protein BO96DRAFT_428278 [Aspergillus niger CBS 101883]
MPKRFTDDANGWVTDPACESVKTVTDDESPIATPVSTLGQKKLVNTTFHHLFAWCVSCTNILLIQCAPKVPPPYMKEISGSSKPSQPISALIAVSCRSCDGASFHKSGKSFDKYPTTLSLSPEWVSNTYMYHNLGKLTPRPMYIAKHGDCIIAVQMDQLSQKMKQEKGKYQILGLNASAVRSRCVSGDAILAPYVSSSFI